MLIAVKCVSFCVIDLCNSRVIWFKWLLISSTLPTHTHTHTLTHIDADGDPKSVHRRKTRNTV